MNTSNNNQQQQQHPSGFRSGPIRNVVGGVPPPLSSGLTVNRPAWPTAPIPSTARHSHEAKPSVQQSYDPFFQQQQRSVSYNIPNVAPTMSTTSTSHETSFTPDNSAQLQPHIVSLPPPPASPKQAVAAATAFQHPLQSPSYTSAPQQQQVAAQSLYQARSRPAAPTQTTQQPKATIYSQQPGSPPIMRQQQPRQQQPNQTAYQVKATTSPTVTSTTQQQQSSSSTIYNQNQTQSPQQTQQKQHKQPTTPDQDLDTFLSIDNSNNHSNSNNNTRPKPLPPTNGVLSKSKLLAQRRAWGDVIRVTSDALIVRNMDGVASGGGGTSDVGKHHSFYSEIVACAMASGPSSPSKASHSAAAAGGNSDGVDKKAPSSNYDIDEIQKLRRETCELIVLRFIAHLKLRRFVDLGKEISMLGLIPFLPDRLRRVDDADDVATAADGDLPLSWKEGSIHSTDPKDKLPPWIPYGLRILAAQQLQYNDGSSKAIDVLIDMRDRAVRTEYWNSSAGIEVWKSTIDNAIVNACIRMKEWRMALHYLEELINGVHEGVDREVHWWCRQESLGGSVGEDARSQLRELITSAAFVELLSRQMLILLQLGAVAAAEAVQGDVRIHAAKMDGIVFTGALSRIHREFALIRQVPVRQMVNDGLILFAKSDYESAAKHFRGAVQLQEEMTAAVHNSISFSNTDAPSPPGYPSWKDLDSPTLGFDADSSLTVDCVNNLSLCLLCTGKMRAAVEEMEMLIRKDPCANLTEGMAFNLCTLYELGSDGEECTRRKKRLQRVAKRFFLHDIGVESFRLN